MTKRLKDKVAIITGAAGGIGAASAARMAEDGAIVVLADIDEAGASEAARQIPGAAAFRLDLANEDEIKALIETVVARFGRIDILLNNAAAQDPEQRARDLDVVNLDIAAWDTAMAVNVRGAMLMCKYAIPHMIEGGGGSIINSASGFGVEGESTLTAYGASKAAMIQLNRMVATQYGRQRIRSNCMIIGFVLTRTALETTAEAIRDIIASHSLTPELGTPQDIANLAAFLASDESAFITGAAIPIDGGFTAHQASYADFRQLFERSGKAAI